jgi:hypothetical protein
MQREALRGLPFVFGGKAEMTGSKEFEQVSEIVGAGKAKYMRPSECRSHMRKTLAREYEEIVKGFIEAAKKGSCPHVKLATELLKPDRKGSTRKKGTATKYWEMLQKEDREKERVKKEQIAAAADAALRSMDGGGMVGNKL